MTKLELDPPPTSDAASASPSQRGPATPLHRFGHLLLTLWAGSLWTICGIVAPTLFALLDRGLAGAAVGRLFAIVAWMGLAIGAVLILLLRTRVWQPQRYLIWLLIITAIAPVLSEIVLGPLMLDARVAGEMHRFAVLHGGSGVLFLVACAGAGALVWQVNRGE